MVQMPMMRPRSCGWERSWTSVLAVATSQMDRNPAMAMPMKAPATTGVRAVATIAVPVSRASTRMRAPLGSGLELAAIKAPGTAPRPNDAIRAPLLVGTHFECRILVCQPRQRHAHLFLVGLGLGFDGHR